MTICRYQLKVTADEFAKALSEARCQNCSISALELLKRAQALEVCGEEFGYDIVTGEKILVAVALCPDCHGENHLDSHKHHNPCQVAARLSREYLV
jgi:hypothetical protein